MTHPTTWNTGGSAKTRQNGRSVFPFSSSHAYKQRPISALSVVRTSNIPTSPLFSLPPFCSCQSSTPACQGLFVALAKAHSPMAPSSFVVRVLPPIKRGVRPLAISAPSRAAAIAHACAISSSVSVTVSQFSGAYRSRRTSGYHLLSVRGSGIRRTNPFPRASCRSDRCA